MFEFINKLFSKNKQAIKKLPDKLRYNDLKPLYKYHQLIGSDAIKINDCSFGLIRSPRESYTLTRQVFITDINLKNNLMTLAVFINSDTDIMNRYIKLWNELSNSDSDFRGTELNLDGIITLRNARLKYISSIIDYQSTAKRMNIVIDMGIIDFNPYAKEQQDIEHSIKQYSTIIKEIDNALLNEKMFSESDLTVTISSNKACFIQNIKDKTVFNNIRKYLNEQINKLKKEKTLYIK